MKGARKRLIADAMISDVTHYSKKRAVDFFSLGPEGLMKLGRAWAKASQ